jgi:hypothetical protein
MLAGDPSRNELWCSRLLRHLSIDLGAAEPIRADRQEHDSAQNEQRQQRDPSHFHMHDTAE